MPDFDDLLTARILSREQPEMRALLLTGLEAVGEGANPRGLLATLLDTRQLTWDQAQWVQKQVDDCKRLLAVEIFASLLAQAGLPAREVYRRCAGPDSSPSSLGQELIQDGLLSEQREHELRFRARVAFDRDVQRQLAEFRESRRPRTEEAAADEPTRTFSQVVKLPNLDRPSPEEGPGLSPEEFMSISSAELPAPEFFVPGWIDTSDARTGESLAGYQLLGRIGKGTSGTVYLASDPKNPKRPTAVKVLREDATSEARGRFERACVASRLFQHPCVLEVYDAGETDAGLPYLATEFFDGETLAEVLEVEGHLSPRRALEIARQLFSALAAAHRAGVIHRDVKPANVLLSTDGESLKLMDFGIAVLSEPGDLSEVLFQSGTSKGLVGTPMYASPEQAFVRKTITAPADLYSAGLVLYEMLSGRLPFEAENTWAYVSCHMNEAPLPLREAAEHTASLPAELHELMGRLLEKSPEKRPESAQLVIEVLDRVAARLEAPTGRWLLGLLGRRRG